MEWELSVELLPVPLDASRSMGATGTVVRAVRLVLLGITSISLVITVVPELQRPELLSLLPWLQSVTRLMELRPGAGVPNQGSGVAEVMPSVTVGHGLSTTRGHGHRAGLCAKMEPLDMIMGMSLMDNHIHTTT